MISVGSASNLKVREHNVLGPYVEKFGDENTSIIGIDEDAV